MRMMVWREQIVTEYETGVVGYYEFGVLRFPPPGEQSIGFDGEGVAP